MRASSRFYDAEPTAARLFRALQSTLHKAGRNGWAGPCPACGGHNRFHISLRENKPAWGCRGCYDGRTDAEKQAARREILKAAGIWQDHPEPWPAPPQKPPSPKTPPGGEDYAARLWRASNPITAGPNSTPRRWAARRHLWRPDHPWPGALRWTPPDGARPGSVTVLLAAPEDWLASWPGLPQPQAVQRIFLDPSGLPVPDRPEARGGTPKRTHGSASGSMLLLGNPAPDMDGPARVCEGAADALAIAARYPSPVWAALTTPDRAPGIPLPPAGAVIHADNDAPGQDSAARLCLRIQRAGYPATIALPASGKDAADAAAGIPDWPALDPDAARQYAATLRELHPDWPLWECCRQATIFAQED